MRLSLLGGAREGDEEAVGRSSPRAPGATRLRSQECAEAFQAVDNRKDSLRGAFVDAAVNLEISLMRQRLRMGDQEIAQAREELQNATPRAEHILRMSS